MNVTQADSFSALLAAFFEKKVRLSGCSAAPATCTKRSTNARDRVARKLAAQKKELAATHNREQYKSAPVNSSPRTCTQLEKGMNKAKVVDYYAENCPEVEITLDVRLTPQQNAQKYFKLYQQGQDRRGSARTADRAGAAELDYLESVLAALSEAENERDLAQLRARSSRSPVCFLPSRRATRSCAVSRRRQSRSITARATDLTYLQAKQPAKRPADTQDCVQERYLVPHAEDSRLDVIPRGRTAGEPTDEASHDRGRHDRSVSFARTLTSSLVPVDYTPVRQVEKPAGAKPGMVIYHVYQTAYSHAGRSRSRKAPAWNKINRSRTF